MIFAEPPHPLSPYEWPKIFRKEFPYDSKPQHMLFTWNPSDKALIGVSEFEAQGFKLFKNSVLAAKKVMAPKRLNSKIKLRALELEADWQKATRLHIDCRDLIHPKETYTTFKVKQMKSYQELTQNGQGARIGAFLGEILVADLGLFFNHDILPSVGRYQNVITHPDYRRQGICSTLVYESARFAFHDWHLKELLMEADPDYHAAQIYESIGFSPTEENFYLYWCAQSKSSK